MKFFVAFLALIATVCALTIDDIPDHMKERLDRYISLKKKWTAKWETMSADERKHYETILLARIENLPKVEMSRIQRKIETMDEEQRVQLLAFLRKNYPAEEGTMYDNENQEIAESLQSLPFAVRERLSDLIRSRLQKASVDEKEDVRKQFPVMNFQSNFQLIFV